MASRLTMRLFGLPARMRLAMASASAASPILQSLPCKLQLSVGLLIR